MSTTHRTKLLDAAQRQILTKGFAATRVDEVCADAGVTKGSFYHHFKSKDELAFVLVERYFGVLDAALTVDAPPDAPPDATAEERLMAFLDHAIRVAKGGLLRDGCLLGSFALDLSETHPEMRETIDGSFVALARSVEPILRDALREADSGLAVSAPSLARQFVSVLQGSIVLAKASTDHGRVAEAIRVYRELLRSILLG